MVVQLKTNQKPVFVRSFTGRVVLEPNIKTELFERKNGMRQYIRIRLLLSSVCKSILTFRTYFFSTLLTLTRNIDLPLKYAFMHYSLPENVIYM